MEIFEKLPDEINHLVSEFSSTPVVGDLSCGITQYSFWLIVSTIVLLIVLAVFKKKQTLVPKGFFVNGFEYIIEYVENDIGKGVDHEAEGTHVTLGAELARKYRESPDVIHAILAHHNDVEPQTVEAVLVQAADAISAARPGARRESLENYIKRLEKLEEIANSFPGVDKCFAIQSGREVRIMVKPEDITDDGTKVLAKEVAKRIEKELEYPGQIRVNVIRETRSTEYAK